MNHSAGKTIRTLALSAVTALFLVASAFAAESGELAVGAGAVTGDGVRLRAEPTTEASILTTLEKNAAAALLDGSVDGWYRISYNGKTGYVSADYFIVDQDNLFETYGWVNASGVRVRAAATTESEELCTLEERDVVDVTGFEDGWYMVTCQDGAVSGYIRSDFLALTNSPTSSSGSSIVDYAKQFLGTRYVYGGASPSGFDCSGFTMYIYRNFGYSISHSATAQWQGTPGTRIYNINELQPGDLVYFNDPSRSNGKACSHAGIYAGGGQIIHSSSSRSGGVIFSDLTSGYYRNYFVGGIHVG